jgi:hypothetical protein
LLPSSSQVTCSSHALCFHFQNFPAQIHFVPAVLVWLPLLAAPPPSSTCRVRHEAEEQLLLSSAQHQKLTVNFNKKVSDA